MRKMKIKNKKIKKTALILGRWLPFLREIDEKAITIAYGIIIHHFSKGDNDNCHKRDFLFLLF